MKIYLLVILTILLSLSACQQVRRNKSHENVAEKSIEDGRLLATQYCSSCHALPQPEWLDAKSWEDGVLPAMGPRLGIFKHHFQYYPSAKNDSHVDKNFYPSAPMLTPAQWQSIIDYYAATAPDTLIRTQSQPNITTGLPLFQALLPPHQYPNAATSFLKLAPPYFGASLISSDAIKQKTYLYNSNLSLADSFTNSGAIVAIEFEKEGPLVCDIGILNPNNGKFGKGAYVKKSTAGKFSQDSNPVIDTLQRPVQISKSDFNGDGKPDYLVGEFGFITGSLAWLEGHNHGSFTRHTLRNLPGTIKAYIQDYNKDGAPDIWVLFAQGDEGIFLCTNDGKGNFKEERVLSFPSVYGSSFFELVDFDKDGHDDIVYTCGDNADYSPILKPYHGVYIFINDGANHFNQKYFYAINGCYKAMARDYDGDGDIDIAAIAFFADYKNMPEEGFVYLKNNGGFQFSPYSIEQCKAGRWLTMDAGDMDGDGDIDLVLGNFFAGPNVSNPNINWSASPPFLLLKNTTR